MKSCHLQQQMEWSRGIMISEMSESMRQTINDLTYMWNLKNKPTNEQTKEKEGRLTATENKLVVAWWLSWGKIGEAVEDTQASLYKTNHRNVIHSIKDMVNNIVINLYRVRWLLDLPWWSFHNEFKY